MRFQIRLLNGWHCLRLVIFSALLCLSIQCASATWLDDQITSIQSKINTLQAGLNNTYAKANAAAAQALAAAQQTNGLQDLLGRVQTAYQNLDGPMIDIINDIVQMIVAYIQEQQNGFDDFVKPNNDGISPADAFRTEMKAIVIESTDFLDELAGLDGDMNLDLDLSAIDRLLEITPDRILYPMQKALTRNGGLEKLNLVDRLTELSKDLPLFQAAYAANGNGQVAYATSTMSDARPLSSWNPSARAAAVEASSAWKKTGNVIGLVAKVTGALGELSEFEGKIGIHGYIAIHYKGNVVKLVAGLLDAVADGIKLNGERLEGIMAADDNRTRDVEAQNRHDEIISYQQLILDGQERLFEAMKRLDPDLFPEVGQTPPSATIALDVPPRRLQVDFGEPVTLTAGAVESPNAVYQWRKDGVPIQGAIYSSLIIRGATAESAGDYDVIITDETGSQVSAASTLALIPGRVMNVSVRQVIPDNGVLITGFVLDSEKQVVVRGVGRSLEAFGIPASQTMQDPLITVYDSANQVVATNDNYERTAESEAAMQALGAFPITADNDAAIITVLPAGAYTVHMKGADLKGGDCIVEVYDTEDS